MDIGILISAGTRQMCGSITIALPDAKKSL